MNEFTVDNLCIFCNKANLTVFGAYLCETCRHDANVVLLVAKVLLVSVVSGWLLEGLWQLFTCLGNKLCDHLILSLVYWLFWLAV